MRYCGLIRQKLYFFVDTKNYTFFLTVTVNFIKKEKQQDTLKVGNIEASIGIRKVYQTMTKPT